jgi:hypothetical protein
MPEASSTAPPAGPPPSDRRRQNQVLASAAILGVAVVVVVLLITLRSGSDDESPTGTTSALVADPTMPAQLAGPIALPEGDYTALCAEVEAQLEGLELDFAAENLAAVYQQLDFDQLAAVAPEGLVPPLRRLEADRELVIDLLGQVSTVQELAPADLPSGYLDALAVVGQAKAVQCDGEAPVGPVTTTAPG